MPLANGAPRDDLPVQFFQEGEVSFGRPAMNATSSSIEFPRSTSLRGTNGVPEPVARQHVNHLKEIVQGNLQAFDQRILYRLRHVTEAAPVVATFEHVDSAIGT